ncbi:LOW QUALITY PROTEIN: probable LRR receptor-like serine/threonine-protein kinase At1g74360 [Actinidia eriantha]|uniref:LOW QUALITY PROTEIN: probable LRR receptor-like serine/threonine-protein kinase At1g74360 n=1 Tax=Actinidia eriantha TaxID=165200 RepID=UPI00258C9C95|nr:LOW QUALITY PROTEIN: probable LRR receptor-like serine/threonine-protein kinase At1g74360 [Actinidia eriantha]
MSRSKVGACEFALIVFLILITGNIVVGDSLESDKEVLLNLKTYLEDHNRVNRGKYSDWNQSSSPCTWPGISCDRSRVTGIDLSDSTIAGGIFGNFSALTALTHLDLSSNTIGGGLPEDLGRCKSLKVLNLAHNIICDVLNLTGLNSLEVIDLSTNRFFGGIQLTFPGICKSLVVANLSTNNFTGSILNAFDQCQNLQFLDLSANHFSGKIWPGFVRLQEFSVAENYLNGVVSPDIFSGNCSLQQLDLSENALTGEVPVEISKCKELVILNLWGNNFTGRIPEEIGNLSSLVGLYLGNNSFSRNIPESLLGLRNLAFLDLSRNQFGDEIQEILGQFTQVKYLVLHSNSYTGGIYSSGILNLPNISRLDLSFNNFSGPLPVEISQMMSLKFLILAYNQFTGSIPPEYGNLLNLQALDLSFNRLNGSIPPSLGNLSSLLWLMLANNSLTGEIPPELGNCWSMLWLNLANNQLSGPIPHELTNIGLNATRTFQKNRQNDRANPASGECLVMRRWIPADYPPFSFVYTLLTRKNCRSIWDRLLKGHGIFSLCVGGVRTNQISGYIQLSTNQLSGEVPPEIGKMKNFSMLHLGINALYGNLPREIGLMPLAVLNITQNKFSGEIPREIGDIKCLRDLDLSVNNFSGDFPISLNNLHELSKFNVSYNPYITGIIPSTGQLATFEKESFLGNPLLDLPPFLKNSGDNTTANHEKKPKKPRKWDSFLVFFALVMVFLVCGILTLVVCLVVKSPEDTPGYGLEDTKGQHEFVSSSGTSSSWLSDTVKVIRLYKTAFTHTDILKATGNFSDDRIIGRGGFGIVYKGMLPDGREIAVKKLQRDGAEGEKEFRAEMEVLSGNGFGWPHPNLVTLYGWCLDGSEKLLVYEYIDGGSLEDLISDRKRLSWRKRIDIATDVARALVFLHHECFPPIVHRDVKASNVLLDHDGSAHVTDFGLARVVDAGYTHVSTMVAGTVGYVAPEYGQTWQATTKGDVYSFGVLAMELATGRRAVDGGEECLVEWARRVMGNGRKGHFGRAMIPVVLLGFGLAEGAEVMRELLKVGIRCTEEMPQARPTMKEVLAMLIQISSSQGHVNHSSSPPSF